MKTYNNNNNGNMVKIRAHNIPLLVNLYIINKFCVSHIRLVCDTNDPISYNVVNW